MKKEADQQLETDVLIIGAGGAGLRAAIEAHNKGVRVLVVSKGDYPTGCITAIAMGAMSASVNRQDSADRHFKDTMRGGYRLNNPRLVRLLVERAAERARDIERYGTEFEKSGGEYDLFPLPGNTFARGVLAGDPYRGGYFKGLVKETARLGIQVLEHVMIFELIKEGQAVVGAAGLDMGHDRLLIIQAKAVVIATGGAGNLYSLTTNIPGITGDGYALGFNAGAKLADMEFMQSRACMIYPAPMRGTPPPADGCVTIGGRFYNGLGERFMKKYFPDKVEQVTRSETARSAQKEILEGRASPHGGVYGDLSGVAREELAKFKGFLQTCAAINFDPSWQAYEWAPGAHYFMGGIVINEKCETGVQGLYAAGEAQTGVMGANRLAGNALTETQVFGAIAGAMAAQRAQSVETPVTGEERSRKFRGRIENLLKREKGIDYREVRREMTETMSLHAGVLRHEEGLRRALQILAEIEQKKIGRICLTEKPSFKALAGIFETENILATSRLIVQAALLRTESRGAHNREDYPEADEKWLKNIVFQRQGEETTVDVIPVAKG
jgi:fumarate reductase (CoM/CoB) subunit A